MSYQRLFDRKIDVAVVGVGSHSYRNILTCMTYLPVNLIAVCDLNKDLAEITAKQYGCKYYTSTKDLYENEKLDGVIICVSPYLHPKLAIEAYSYNINVWMEKPAAAGIREINEMKEKCGDLVTTVGFKKAFMPSTQKVCNTIKSGKYGQLNSMLATYQLDVPGTVEEAKEALNGKMSHWLANSCHPVSLLLQAGGKVSDVNVIRSRKGGLVEIFFESGVIGNLHMATGPLPIENYFFFLDDAYIQIENGLKVKLSRGVPMSYGQTVDYISEDDDHGMIVWEPQNTYATLEGNTPFTQGMYFELKHFCDRIMKVEVDEVLGDLDFAYEVTKVYEMVLQKLVLAK